MISKAFVRRSLAIVAAAVLVAGGSTASAATPVADSNSASGPFKIGYIVPLSGAGASGGQAMVEGMKLYLDQIGHTMAGRKVDLVIENNESNPATAVAKLRKLVESDKVPILGGAYFAHILYALAPRVEEYKVPFICTVSGADDITQRKRGKWLIRTSWTSSQLSQPFGDWAYRSLGYRRVVTIGSDYSYGYEVVGGFQKSFEGAGGQVVQKLWAPMGFTDFKTLLQQIRSDADAVFMVLVGPQGEILSQQYREMGIKLPIIGAGGTQFDETTSLSKCGQYLVGGVHAAPYSTNLPGANNKLFVKAFRDKYGQDPGFIAECGYDTGMWIHKAVEAIHGDVENREKFLSALKAVQLADAPRGPMKLDSYGNVVDNIYVTKTENNPDGHYFNKVIETFPMISQFWKWKPEQFLKQPVYSKGYPPCVHCASKP